MFSRVLTLPHYHSILAEKRKDFQGDMISCFSAPPSIVRWEDKVVYQRDSTVRLFCEADGNPAPNVTIKRIKDGKQEELKNLRTYGNGSVYISFTDSKKADGRYACFANNIAGKIVRYSQLSEQGSLECIFYLSLCFIRRQLSPHYSMEF